jgi:hypothetical protein
MDDSLPRADVGRSVCWGSSSASGPTVQLQLVPLLSSPLTFSAGASIVDMLPPVWQTVTLFNPVVYLISGFRWAYASPRRRRCEPRHDDPHSWASSQSSPGSSRPAIG